MAIYCQKLNEIFVLSEEQILFWVNADNFNQIEPVLSLTKETVDMQIINQEYLLLFNLKNIKVINLKNLYFSRIIEKNNRIICFSIVLADQGIIYSTN